MENCDIGLPDIATPIISNNTLYFLDGAAFDSQRMAFVPNALALRASMLTGQVQVLKNQPKFPRIKCAIVKDKTEIYLLGGYGGAQKIPTKQC